MATKLLDGHMYIIEYSEPPLHKKRFREVVLCRLYSDEAPSYVGACCDYENIDHARHLVKVLALIDIENLKLIPFKES